MKSLFPKVIASLFVLSLLVTSCDDAPEKKPVKKTYSYNREQRKNRQNYRPAKPVPAKKYKKRCKCKKRRTRCCSVTTKMLIVR